jgi:catechol 2,3-dioxygenase-like lactoylglutathione lyase family enzyme
MVTPRKLGHVGIYVRDLEKSKKFYCEIGGLKISDELPGWDDRSRPADQWRRLDHV